MLSKWLAYIAHLQFTLFYSNGSHLRSGHPLEFTWLPAKTLSHVGMSSQNHFGWQILPLFCVFLDFPLWLAWYSYLPGWYLLAANFHFEGAFEGSRKTQSQIPEKSMSTLHKSKEAVYASSYKQPGMRMWPALFAYLSLSRRKRWPVSGVLRTMFSTKSALKNGSVANKNVQCVATPLS
jgi:hypothetical protein